MSSFADNTDFDSVFAGNQETTRMNGVRKLFGIPSLMAVMILTVASCGGGGGGGGSPAAGPTGVLFATDGGGANVGQLYTLNLTTGAPTAIGPINYSVTGLAIRPNTGVLYGVTTGSNPKLITINKASGAGAEVGPLFNPLPNPFVGPVADITFTSDGTLYGWSEQIDDLVTIDLTTGNATPVGPDTLLSTSGSGIAASSGGVLYFTGESASGTLRTIAPSTGASLTSIPLVGGGTGQINALAFNGSTLYGVRSSASGGGGGQGGGGGGGTPSTTHLITINTTTGAVVIVGQSVNNLDGIVFDNF
jgi:hypothetical protein